MTNVNALLTSITPLCKTIFIHVLDYGHICEEIEQGFCFILSRRKQDTEVRTPAIHIPSYSCAQALHFKSLNKIQQREIDMVFDIDYREGGSMSGLTGYILFIEIFFESMHSSRHTVRIACECFANCCG